MAVKSDSGELAASGANLTQMYYSKRELTTSSYWSTGRPTDDEYLTEKVYLSWMQLHERPVTCPGSRPCVTASCIIYRSLFFSESVLRPSITALLLSIRSCPEDKIKLAWLIWCLVVPYKETIKRKPNTRRICLLTDSFNKGVIIFLQLRTKL